MKSYEKESFLKIFLFLFTVLLFFSTLLAVLYYHQKIQELDNNLLLQMREYNFNFKGDKFVATIVKKSKNLKTDRLYKGDNEIFSLFLISKKSKNLLKVIYPKHRYEKDKQRIFKNILLIYLLFLALFFVVSIFYALYALKPMKDAVNMIEEFLKDIIHDINTPITTILLNTKFLLKKSPNEELKRIEISANRILGLYKNFEIGVKGIVYKKELLRLDKLLQQRVEFFKSLYPHINFICEIEPIERKCNKEAFIRIVDNLISNACKYSKPQNPKVYIYAKDNKVIIKDNGIGIKDIKKVFDRFYKESEMGIGIGLNIVKKLCNELGIDIKIESKKNIGTKIELTFN